MKITRRELRQPVAELFPRLAEPLIDEGGAAAARLAGTADVEALHDFRVAVRRLRTALRTYQPFLNKKAVARLAKALRRITKATNPRRESQVHVQWLEKQLQRPHLPRRQQIGLRIVLEELTVPCAEKETSNDQLVKQWRDLEGKLHKRLRPRRLKGRAASGAPGSSPGPGGAALTFAQASGEIVGQECRLLRQCLEALESTRDEESVHGARLAAKRLRYVLEPLVKALPGSRRAVGELKKLQDLLGEVHDLQVLESEVGEMVEDSARHWAQGLVRAATESPPGVALVLRGRGMPAQLDACRHLIQVIGRLRHQQDRLIKMVRRQRLGPRLGPWLDRIEVLGDRLLGRLPAPGLIAAGHGGGDTVPSPGR